MNQSLIFLLGSALAVGGIHTLLGPDHYIPFIALSKARKWPFWRTIIITTCCGIGHVASALFLGGVAVAVGITLTKLNILEGLRNTLAAWLLIGFGFAYFLWGLRQAYRKKQHTHAHFHCDGSVHCHDHNHHQEHAHVHERGKRELTPWVLFIIFILGPCEPLIPLIMYPAVKGSIINTILVTVVFGLATLVVMLTMVIAAVYGVKLIKFSFLERYGNALAGAIICSCGLAIKFFGL
jgi:nickel/cobalt transporter (NicO) family protein